MKTTVYKTVFMFEDGEWIADFTSPDTAGVWNAVLQWSECTDEYLDRHCDGQHWIWVKVEVQEDDHGAISICL